LPSAGMSYGHQYCGQPPLPEYSYQPVGQPLPYGAAPAYPPAADPYTAAHYGYPPAYSSHAAPPPSPQYVAAPPPPGGYAAHPGYQAPPQYSQPAPPQYGYSFPQSEAIGYGASSALGYGATLPPRPRSPEGSRQNPMPEAKRQRTNRSGRATRVGDEPKNPDAGRKKIRAACEATLTRMAASTADYVSGRGSTGSQDSPAVVLQHSGEAIRAVAEQVASFEDTVAELEMELVVGRVPQRVDDTIIQKSQSSGASVVDALQNQLERLRHTAEDLENQVLDSEQFALLAALKEQQLLLQRAQARIAAQVGLAGSLAAARECITAVVALEDSMTCIPDDDVAQLDGEESRYRLQELIAIRTELHADAMAAKKMCDAHRKEHHGALAFQRFLDRLIPRLHRVEMAVRPKSRVLPEGLHVAAAPTEMPNVEESRQRAMDVLEEVTLFESAAREIPGADDTVEGLEQVSVLLQTLWPRVRGVTAVCRVLHRTLQSCLENQVEGCTEDVVSDFGEVCKRLTEADEEITARTAKARRAYDEILAQEEEDKDREGFAQYDADGDGKWNMTEIQAFCVAGGCVVSEDRIRQILGAVAGGEEQEYSYSFKTFQTFVAALTHAIRQAELEQAERQKAEKIVEARRQHEAKQRAAFDEHDTKKSGVWEAAELASYCEAQGFAIPHDKAVEMLQTVAGEQEQISYELFVKQKHLITNRILQGKRERQVKERMEKAEEDRRKRLEEMRKEFDEYLVEDDASWGVASVREYCASKGCDISEEQALQVIKLSLGIGQRAESAAEAIKVPFENFHGLRSRLQSLVEAEASKKQQELLEIGKALLLDTLGSELEESFSQTRDMLKSSADLYSALEHFILTGEVDEGIDLSPEALSKTIEDLGLVLEAVGPDVIRVLAETVEAKVDEIACETGVAQRSLLAAAVPAHFSLQDDAAIADRLHAVHQLANGKAGCESRIVEAEGLAAEVEARGSDLKQKKEVDDAALQGFEDLAATNKGRIVGILKEVGAKSEALCRQFASVFPSISSASLFDDIRRPLLEANAKIDRAKMPLRSQLTELAKKRRAAKT